MVHDKVFDDHVWDNLVSNLQMVNELSNFAVVVFAPLDKMDFVTKQFKSSPPLHVWTLMYGSWTWLLKKTAKPFLLQNNMGMITLIHGVMDEVTFNPVVSKAQGLSLTYPKVSKATLMAANTCREVINPSEKSVKLLCHIVF